MSAALAFLLALAGGVPQDYEVTVSRSFGGHDPPVCFDLYTPWPLGSFEPSVECSDRGVHYFAPNGAGIFQLSDP
jgi:hypothetical protein